MPLISKSLVWIWFADDKSNIRFGGVIISSALIALDAFTLPFPDTSIGNLSSNWSYTISVVVIKIDLTSCGVSSGFFCKINAAVPATCGAAKLVPLEIL